MIEQSVQIVSEHPDYQVLKRVPEQKLAYSGGEKVLQGAIIDLEATGCNYTKDAIIEIGLLRFGYTAEGQIVSIDEHYNELNDPKKKIPKDIVAITGITNEAVKGKTIDWQQVQNLLEPVDMIICHNSAFDRKFLERQTPEHIAKLVQQKAFGCTFADISWKKLGFESSKLDYLNWKLGYFYESHRALTDCWATLNLLVQNEKAFASLLESSQQDERLICAINSPFEKKQMLKNRRYRWSDGSGILPKCWWTSVQEAQAKQEKEWLAENIYQNVAAVELLPQKVITALERFSERAETF